MNDKELLKWADTFRVNNEHPQNPPDVSDVAWIVGKLADRIRELKGE